jgi:hypothetical protein
MVEFLQGVVPVRYVDPLSVRCGGRGVSLDAPLSFGTLADDCRIKGSEQLISSEKQSNTANYKFTYSVEIVPVCKDDLVCLPRSQARAWGNISYVELLGSLGLSYSPWKGRPRGQMYKGGIGRI